MIIVKLSGGIGNQLFQYAAARRLALKHRVPLKLDITGFASEADREYSLGVFSVAAEVAKKEEIQWLRRQRLYGRRHMPLIWLEQFNLLHLPRVYRHLDPSFFPALLSAGGNSYLEGYWQSEDYFSDQESAIRGDLNFQCKWRPEVQSLASNLLRVKSLSLHVRRGDYVSNDANLRNHGVCSVDYYEKALRWCIENYIVDQVVVFSDEPEWVSQHLDLPAGSVHASRTTRSDVEDLYLMTCCQIHIIANSSFSWWGAWLANVPDHPVVAPVRWFANKDFDASRIVPPRWIRI